MYQRFHVSKDNKNFFEGNVDYDDKAQCDPAVRKKPHFTHVRDNLRGDVSGKRFSMHAMERNVVRIGEGRCGNNKGMESASGK